MKLQNWNACYEVRSCLAQIEQYVTRGKWLGGKGDRTPAAVADVLIYILNEGQHMAQVVLLLWYAEVLYSLGLFFFFPKTNFKIQSLTNTITFLP